MSKSYCSCLNANNSDLKFVDAMPAKIFLLILRQSSFPPDMQAIHLAAPAISFLAHSVCTQGARESLSVLSWLHSRRDTLLAKDLFNITLLQQ